MSTGNKVIAWLFAVVLGGAAALPARAAEPVKVKVFVAAMFEIGQNSGGDRAGEFQHWYERYWLDRIVSDWAQWQGGVPPLPAK